MAPAKYLTSLMMSLVLFPPRRFEDVLDAKIVALAAHFSGLSAVMRSAQILFS